MKKKKEKELLDGIDKFLVDKYGAIDPSWNINIQLLKDTVHRYNQVREEIDKTGIYSGGVKNPLLSTEKDCLATILKLSQRLGISPYDIAKLKKVESSVADHDDDVDDYIDGLTN